MQNIEKIYNDRAKIAVSARRLAPQDLRQNKYSLEYLFWERAIDSDREHRHETKLGIEQTADKLKFEC